MNNQRRKSIEAVLARISADLSTLIDPLKSAADDLGTELAELQEAEQAYFDNMPESLQESERGQQASEAAEKLQSAYDSINGLSEFLEGFDLDEVTTQLEEAKA